MIIAGLLKETTKQQKIKVTIGDRESIDPGIFNGIAPCH